MSLPHVTMHRLDGRTYAVDDHRIIREPGPFKDQPIYAPYFWNAYLDGTYDDEYAENDAHVIVFNVTDDDRYDYPELTSATKVCIWEDARGVLRTRVDRHS